MKNLLASPSVRAQTGSRALNRKVLGFAAVAVLGVLLLINPTLFCVALMAGFVGTTWFPALSLPAAPVPDAARHLKRLADAAPVALIAAAAAWMAVTAPLPVDDLLRHILARGWGYDYVPHYANHILPTHWSWTIGFDMLVGAIQNWTHDVLTTSRIIRAAETAFVGAMLLLTLNTATSSKALRFAALSVAFYGLVWPRLQLGRPEIFFTGLVFAAAFMSRRLWLTLYLVMAPLYVFAPIYAVAALMLGRQDENLRRRLVLNGVVAGVAIASSVLFWMVYTGGEYPVVFGLLHQVLSTQSAKHMQVGELLPLLAAMASPLALAVLVVLLCLSWTHAKRLAQRPADRVQFLTILAVAACFCVPDYVRYVPIIWSLFVVAALYAAGDVGLSLSARRWVWLAGIIFAALSITPRGEPIPAGMLDTLRVPDGSKILAPFNRSSYVASAANPTAQVTPIFDIGAVTQPAQDVVRHLTEGDFDCSVVVPMGFDYVIENTLVGQPPACLRLVATQGSMRVWALTKVHLEAASSPAGRLSAPGCRKHPYLEEREIERRYHEDRQRQRESERRVLQKERERQTSGPCAA